MNNNNARAKCKFSFLCIVQVAPKCMNDFPHQKTKNSEPCHWVLPVTIWYKHRHQDSVRYFTLQSFVLFCFLNLFYYQAFLNTAPVSGYSKNI